MTISRNFSFPPFWKKRRKNPSDFVKTIKTMKVKKKHLFHWLIFAKYKVNSLHQDDILLVDFDWTGQNHHIGEHWHWTDFHTSNIGFLDGVLCIMEEFGFYFKMLSVFCIKYPFFICQERGLLTLDCNISKPAAVIINHRHLIKKCHTCCVHISI